MYVRDIGKVAQKGGVCVSAEVLGMEDDVYKASLAERQFAAAARAARGYVALSLPSVLESLL